MDMIENMMLSDNSKFKTVTSTHVATTGSSCNKLYFDDFFSKETRVPDEYFLVFIPSSSRNVGSSIDHLLITNSTDKKWGSISIYASNYAGDSIFTSVDKIVISKEGNHLLFTDSTTYGFERSQVKYILYYRYNN